MEQWQLYLPHGVLFRGAAEGKIREKLLRSGNIYAVIGLPANLFLQHLYSDLYYCIEKA